MMRLTIRITIPILLLFSIVLGSIYFLSSTYGLKTIAKLVNIFIPGVYIKNTHGSLANHFELDGIKYTNKNFHFYTEHLKVTWKYRDFFYGKINITNFTTENGTIVIINNKNKFKSSFELHIKNAVVNNYKIRLVNFNKWANSKTVNIHELIFSTGLSHNKHKANNLVISKLIGSENTTPIQGKMNISWKKNDFQIKKFDLTVGNNKLLMNGTYTNKWNLNWLLLAPQLEKIGFIRGDLYSKGLVTGTIKKPLISATLMSKNLFFNDNQVKNIAASLQLGFLPDSQIKVHLNTGEITSKNKNLSNLSLNIDGTLQNHGIQLEATGSNNHFNLKINGKTNLKSWEGYISQVILRSENFYHWQNQNSTKLLISRNTIQLNPICLQSNDKKLCANFLWRKKYGINGKIFLNTDDLRWVSDLIPKTENAKGLLYINLDVSGHLKKPIILGQVKLTNGYINIPDYNTSLKNVQIIGQGDPRGMINWKGNASVGSNTLYMTGKSFLNQNGYPTELSLHGENITFADTQSYKIIANPQATLSYTDHTFLLKGNIFITKALVQTNEFQGDSVTLADDIVFIDTKNKEKKSVIQFQSYLNINLGDNTFINIDGITGQVIGKILLNYDPRDMTTAKGEINIINGKYSAYGRKLTIDKGKLFFTGEKINNPYVDLIASKIVHTNTRANATLGTNFLSSFGLSQQGEVLVGVNITGRLKNYQVKLFSQPGGYSDADILSLMLFDTTTTQVTSVNRGQALLNAATQLNLAGGNLTDVTEELQNAFGLEELGLSNESLYNPATKGITINPSFTIGKRIGHNLLLSYSIGIFDPISIIKLRYDITSNWNIQTDASVLGRGFDVFYTIEK